MAAQQQQGPSSTPTAWMHDVHVPDVAPFTREAAQLLASSCRSAADALAVLQAVFDLLIHHTLLPPAACLPPHVSFATNRSTTAAAAWDPEPAANPSLGRDDPERLPAPVSGRLTGGRWRGWQERTGEGAGHAGRAGGNRRGPSHHQSPEQQQQQGGWDRLRRYAQILLQHYHSSPADAGGAASSARSLSCSGSGLVTGDGGSTAAAGGASSGKGGTPDSASAGGANMGRGVTADTTAADGASAGKGVTPDSDAAAGSGISAGVSGSGSSIAGDGSISCGGSDGCGGGGSGNGGGSGSDTHSAPSVGVRQQRPSPAELELAAALFWGPAFVQLSDTLLTGEGVYVAQVTWLAGEGGAGLCDSLLTGEGGAVTWLAGYGGAGLCDTLLTGEGQARLLTGEGQARLLGVLYGSLKQRKSADEWSPRPSPPQGEGEANHGATRLASAARTTRTTTSAADLHSLILCCSPSISHLLYLTSSPSTSASHLHSLTLCIHLPPLTSTLLPSAYPHFHYHPLQSHPSGLQMPSMARRYCRQYTGCTTLHPRPVYCRCCLGKADGMGSML